MNDLIQEEALFKLSYGLFFLGSKAGEKSNVCVVNTVSQLTQTPLRISVTVLKSNFTAEIINTTKLFTVGVMGENTLLEDVANFGQQSGRDTDKLKGFNYQLDSRGIPVYTKNCIAQMSAEVIETIDLDTHYLFIADIYEAKTLSDDMPITYADYRVKKAGGTAAKKQSDSAWQCSICHYVYDGDIPFEDLPDDYVCPVCGQPKGVFKKA